MKLPILIFFMYITLLLMPTLVIADSDGLKDYIRSNPKLTEENIFIYQGLDNDFLVSIGVADIKSNSPHDKLVAMRLAQVAAQGEIMKYLNGVFSSSEKEFKDIIVFSEGKDLSQFNESRKFSEILKEKGQGIIENVKEIMRWKSQDNRKYFIALGLEMKRQ